MHFASLEFQEAFFDSLLILVGTMWVREGNTYQGFWEDYQNSHWSAVNRMVLVQEILEVVGRILRRMSMMGMGIC